MKHRILPVLAVLMIGGCSALQHSDVSLYDAMSADDVIYAAKTTQSGLETAKQGEVRLWKNPASGTSGSIEVGSTFIDEGGAFCRDYLESIKLSDGRTGKFENTACRTENGTWQWI